MGYCAQVEMLDMLMEHIDKANHKRTCSYLTSFARYKLFHIEHFMYLLYLRFHCLVPLIDELLYQEYDLVFDEM